MEDTDRYIVSARKYRPGTFGSVVGQDALTRTLRNAAGSGRLAHAYLFCGPRGVGKTSCARIFAKRINCLHPTADGEACGECESCRAIASGSSFNIVELDAASNNSVNDIRELMEQVNMPPQTGSYRVFIIDEVHMLSPSAFNAFLKTLEEPPSYVVFILATTEKHKVLPTILSRCQIYDFHRITVNDMVRHLEYVASSEGVEAEQAALAVIAQKADGAMRDALSIFDQVAAMCGGHITYDQTIASLNVLDYSYYFRLTDAFREGNVAQALLIYKEIRDRGFDSLFFINGLASHVRDLMVASDASTACLLEAGEEIGRRYAEYARKMPLGWYYSAMRLLNDADLNYRTSGNKQLLVELCLIRLCGQGNSSQVSATQPELSGGASSGVSAAPSSTTPRKTGESTVPSGSPSAQPSAQKESGTVRAENAGAVHQQPQPVRRMPPAVPRQPGMGRQATPRAPRPGGSPAVFHIRTEGGEGAAPESDPPARGHRDSEFSEADFTRAWEAFASDHRECRLLVTAMRNLDVKRHGNVVNLVVATPAQAASFEGDLGKLTAYLRDALSNDDIIVGVEEGAQREVRARRLLPPEVLKKIVGENKVIADLIKEIDAEMA